MHFSAVSVSTNLYWYKQLNNILYWYIAHKLQVLESKMPIEVFT